MIQFHDPRGEIGVEITPYQLGLKVRGANQITIGLLANGFPDSVNFLAKIGKVIEEQEPGVTLEYYNKGNASIPASDAILASIKEHCQAVVSVYGH